MDDKARTPSGGVRNLRAMFENRDNSEESTGSPQPNRGHSDATDGGKSASFPPLYSHYRAAVSYGRRRCCAWADGQTAVTEHSCRQSSLPVCSGSLSPLTAASRSLKGSNGLKPPCLCRSAPYPATTDLAAITAPLHQPALTSIANQLTLIIARATHSPGPSKLTKVQTNFIAVDKPSKTGTTQWGLRINNNNSNTNNGTTSTNNSTNTTPNIEKNDPITILKRSTDKTVGDNSKKENTYTQDNIISPPSEPEMPRRRDSFSLHDDLPADHKTIQARKASIAEEFRNRAHSIQIGAAAEPIPEFAVETPALETPAVDGNRARHQLGYVEPPIPRTTANPDKPTNNNEPGVHMSPSDPKSENAVTDGRALQGASIRNLTGGDAKSMREAAVQGLKTTPAKATLAMRPTPASPAAQARSQAGASTNANKPLRSPPLEKIPASPAAAQRTAVAGNRNVSSASTASAKTATKSASSTANGAPKPATSTARSSATGPTASAAAKKAPAAASTSGTGFHKPKPKSPTRPAKLPSSLLAPTASSISKVAGAENNTTTQKRRESHGSLAPNKATAQSKLRGESLKHTTSHNRPSVGPPPSSAAHKKPTTSTTKPSGDSFLERMMRPTAASANKAVNHDTHPSPPKPAVTKSSTPAHSRPMTREKVHADKSEKKEDTPKKVAEEKTIVDKILEEKQADPNQQDPNPKPVERDQLNQDPKILEPRFSRPSLEERVSEPISPKTETPPKTETSPPPAGEVPPPKAEAPPVAESKEDAIKTEVPKTYQEPHQDPPMPSSPKASLPSHAVPKVIKTERTISITDMENSDGTIKKLPPGAIPIPKIAKKKKPSVESPKAPESSKRNSKSDVTDVPKEKKRDFLLEVREEEKRHRRMSERPSMVKNPTTIPEAAEEVDEEIDDHQLHTPSPTMGTSGSEADISGGSEMPRSTPKKAPSPKKPLSPAKETAPPGLQPTEKRERRDSIADNALESAAISNSDVDDVDIALGAPSPSSQIKSQATGRRLSHVAEKAMDYAAQAVDEAAQKVDDALQHKLSTAEKADKAEDEEADAVQSLSKGHPLTSAMLNGSALDTDDEYTPTPSAEARGNPFDNLEGSEKPMRRESKAGDGNFSIAPTFKEGEAKVAEDRQNGNAEPKE